MGDGRKAKARKMRISDGAMHNTEGGIRLSDEFLRRLRLYLGCLSAPTLIFFAVSGSWQLFNWHESTGDHSYTAPHALAVLSDIHKGAHIPPTPNRKPTPLRYFLFAAAVSLVTTTILGVIMGY